MTRESYGRAYQGGFESRYDSSDLAECLEQLRNDNMVVTWVNTIALNVHTRLLRSEPAWHVLAESGTIPGAAKLAGANLAQMREANATASRQDHGPEFPTRPDPNFSTFHVEKAPAAGVHARETVAIRGTTGEAPG